MTQFKNDIENDKGKINVYMGIDRFETKEFDRFNSEGIELSKKSEYEKAELIFLKALRIEPNNPTILNNFRNVKKHHNKYEESIKYYEKSLIISDSLYL